MDRKIMSKSPILLWWLIFKPQLGVHFGLAPLISQSCQYPRSVHQTLGHLGISWKRGHEFLLSLMIAIMAINQQYLLWTQCWLLPLGCPPIKTFSFLYVLGSSHGAANTPRQHISYTRFLYMGRAHFWRHDRLELQHIEKSISNWPGNIVPSV